MKIIHVALVILCLLMGSWLTADQSCHPKVLLAITASNTVEPEEGSRQMTTGGHVKETFNAVFSVKARFLQGGTITQESVDTGWQCSHWSWDIQHGTEPTKILFVPATTTCDAVVSHKAGGGNSTVSIGARVTYTYNNVTKDDASSGSCTFFE